MILFNKWGPKPVEIKNTIPIETLSYLIDRIVPTEQLYDSSPACEELPSLYAQPHLYFRPGRIRARLGENTSSNAINITPTHPNIIHTSSNQFMLCFSEISTFSCWVKAAFFSTKFPGLLCSQPFTWFRYIYCAYYLPKFYRTGWRSQPNLPID